MKNKKDLIKSEFLKIEEKIKNMGPPKSDEETEYYKLILKELEDLVSYLENIKKNKN